MSDAVLDLDDDVDTAPRRLNAHELLAQQHARRSAIRAVAGLCRDTPDFHLLTDMLGLDPAEARADLPPLVLTPVIPAAPERPEKPDTRAPGLRFIATPQQEAPRQVARARVKQRPVDLPPPADGICPTEGCGRPYKHTGIHATPKAPPPPPPADGLCLTPTCDRPYRHTGTHRTPAGTPRSAPAPRATRTSTPLPFDIDAAAERYQGGEKLDALAASLHVAKNRLRQALVDHGVRIRARGEVVGRRGPAPRTLDVTEAIRLYVDEDLDTSEVARRLGVKSIRVSQALRDAGVLKRALRTAAALDVDRCRQLYTDGLSTAEVAKQLGVRVSRVNEQLRADGMLRRPGGQHAATPTPRVGYRAPGRVVLLDDSQRPRCSQPGCDKPNRHTGRHRTAETAQITTKLTPEHRDALLAWATELGQTPAAYIRSLIVADLTCQGRL